MTTETASQKVE
jgi:hypothetical protein